MMTPIMATDLRMTRIEVAGLVALAARTVPPLWPLESAIAVNPLAGFEELPFTEAVGQAAALFGARPSLPLAQWRHWLAAGQIDQRALRDTAIEHLGGIYAASAYHSPGVTRLDALMARLMHAPMEPQPALPSTLAPDAAFIAKWCAAFFDQGLAAAAMPRRELGLYRAVLSLLPADAEYRRLTGAAGRQLLLTVPRDPLEAIAEALSALSVPSGCERDWLAALVARLPGWAGHIRWRCEYADPIASRGAPAAIADLLALWCLVARAGALSAMPWPEASTGDSEAGLGHVFMVAAERTYADTLIPQLEATAQATADDKAPDAQLVFCIDVRSEPFRRALEAQGRYETLGYAGFFGLPIAVHRAGEAGRRKLLPVLLGPQHDLAEAPAPGCEGLAAQRAIADASAHNAGALFARGKQGSATAFATAEATGPLAGLLMAARTLTPRLVQRIARRFAPDRNEAFAPALDRHITHCEAPAFTLEEKIGYAGALFKLTGLSPQTARLVALVGHGGSAVNNPYAAALDCGACGGHAGGTNARVLAAMLNDPAVRVGLAGRGLTLPETTWFIAAEHNTTTDEVTILDRCQVPPSHHADLAALTTSLATAGETNRARRAGLLGRTADDLLTGAVHWGEVRPEWGLAGNAAFLVGPRSWTRGIDLAGRAFLHSYDWRQDEDGMALTTILTAPMVVAQWINCQYLFSTIDNHRYGSGDKVTQNVVGGIGVVQGNGGDLKVGLPRQSLFADDGAPYHLPQRLLSVVLAPLDRVEKVVAANDILARLFGKGWVQLIVVDPVTGQALRWRRDDETDREGTAPREITA